MTVVTRFAPSPTGFLHIGGARTALFNWLYAKHHGGIFRLRIEDTDRKRSTEEAIEAILDGLKWLELDWDQETVYQSARAERHVEAANSLLAAGHAYRCYCTPEELEEIRSLARAEKRHMRYDGRWRDRDPSEAPEGIDPVIRLKAPRSGSLTIEDEVQGSVTVAHEELDDMVLLRADGTPTYMLSVVVDDHDMEITHVIRGDDHLTNAFRQTLLYQALGWEVPRFAHIPLIHGPDGSKLSKRHGALGVEAYREMGYLPEALNNYLLRLGWGHGDDEIISRAQAVEWFDLDAVGKAAARFDFAKLENLNGHYLREAKDSRLRDLCLPIVEKKIGHSLNADQRSLLEKAMPGMKQRAKLVTELAENAVFYFAKRPLELTDKAAKLLNPEARALLSELLPRFEQLQPWTEEGLETLIRSFIEEKSIKLGAVAQPLRCALTGSTMSPGLFEVMALLGRDEALARVRDQAKSA